MKLPTDPKERNQIFVLIGLVAVGVVVGIFFAFKWVNGQQKALENTYAELEVVKKQADAKITRMQIDRTDNEKALKQILQTAEEYVIVSEYEEYDILTRDILDKYAKELGLQMEPVRGLGEAALPAASGKPTFKAYTARVSMNCGMHDLVKFLHKLETSNPYLSISGITVTERRAQDPEKPQVSFEVQWPIWSDVETNGKLENELAELSQEGV